MLLERLGALAVYIDIYILNAHTHIHVLAHSKLPHMCLKSFCVDLLVK